MKQNIREEKNNKKAGLNRLNVVCNQGWKSKII